jgi:hypothetical protein
MVKYSIYSPMKKENQDILTTEDMARITECESDLVTLKRKFKEECDNIIALRVKIKALYKDNRWVFVGHNNNMLEERQWCYRMRDIRDRYYMINKDEIDFNDNMDSLQTLLNEKMTNVDKMATLRDKAPNYNTPIINKIKADIAKLIDKQNEAKKPELRPELKLELHKKVRRMLLKRENVEDRVYKGKYWDDPYPTYKNPEIYDIEDRIKKLESFIESIRPLTDDELKFRSFSTYNVYKNEYDKQIYFRVLDFKKEIESAKYRAWILNNAIAEDTWLGKYLVYARMNNLNVDSESLFQDCNNHYLNSHANYHTLKCECKSYIDTTDEDDYHANCSSCISSESDQDESSDELSISMTEYIHRTRSYEWYSGKCRHGNRLYIKYHIGIIDNSNPLESCKLDRC